MKIIDAFVFYNEIDILKMRLEFLYDAVDYFVICESRVTFAGNKKPWNLEKHKAELAQWMDKIIYLQFEPTDAFLAQCKSAWDVEKAQRNFLATELVKFDKNDWVIVSDVDEIWNPESVLPFLNDSSRKKDIYYLEMLFHYCYLNCRGIGSGNAHWRKAFLVKVSFLKKHNDLDGMRMRKPKYVLKNGGWHFSFMGGAEMMANKLENASHQELNTDEIKNITRLEKCMREGKDPFGREDHEWAYHPVDYFPERLAVLMKKFPYLLRLSLT